MTKGVRHGMRFTREYSIWCNMKTRCNNPNFKDAKYYSEKGITYDTRWEKFEAFYEDLGPCPKDHTLDRRDSSLGYYKENCRWATHSEQAQNAVNPLGGSGIRGVSYHKKHNPKYCTWEARTDAIQGVRQSLYSGKDFFLACCARKSWEVQNVIGQ